MSKIDLTLVTLTADDHATDVYVVRADVQVVGEVKTKSL